MSKTIENNYDIYFAGLARDCESTLKENITTLLEICESISSNNCKILIAENDSQDETRDILAEFETSCENVRLFLFDDLDEDYPIREERIAYLRSVLYKEIQNISEVEASDVTKLYVPVDLDSKIVQSIDINQFLRECRRVANEEANAVFPASKPYYYDIYALRAEGWLEINYWEAVINSQTRLGSTISKIKYKYMKQKHIKYLKYRDRIEVQSAYGGVGIYNLKKLNDASYKRDGGYPKDICEHVIFNNSVNSKEISTDFVIQAPEEHMRYKIPTVGRITMSINSILSPLKKWW